MSKRINVMIDEDTWEFLGRVPAGERSRAVNEALRAWVTRRRRRDAVRKTAALGAQLPKIKTEEVTRRIRRDCLSRPTADMSIGSWNLDRS